MLNRPAIIVLALVTAAWVAVGLSAQHSVQVASMSVEQVR
jgi:hypothetical protein